MVVVVAAACSGPLIDGVPVAPETAAGRVIDVRRTLDFCTWQNTL